jgi:hypothetical protein
LHVLPRQHPPKQCRPCALRFGSRDARFIAGCFRRGFTPPHHTPPRRSGHLMPSVRHRSAVETLLLVRPFALRLLRPLLTSRSVSPRQPFGRKAGSPRVRAHSLTAHPPDLHHLSLGHESFAVFCPLALLRRCLLSGSCPSGRSFAPRFLPTVGHPSAVALHFARRDQLAVGLTPTRVRPCRAHEKMPPATDVAGGISRQLAPNVRAGIRNPP